MACGSRRIQKEEKVDPKKICRRYLFNIQGKYGTYKKGGKFSRLFCW